MRKELVQLIREGKEIKFYKSKEWRTTREEVFQRDNRECRRCKSRGKFSKGDCVHHIIHLKDNPYLALDKNNLVTLCNSCHNEEHPEKLKKFRKKIITEERW